MSVDYSKPLELKLNGQWRPARIVGEYQHTDHERRKIFAVVDSGSLIVERPIFSQPSEADIRNAPVTYTWWVNMYRSQYPTYHASRKLADDYDHGTPLRIACLNITFAEGDGL